MFEYMTIYVPGMLSEYDINKYAKDGWRLYSAVPGSNGILLIFEKAPSPVPRVTIAGVGTWQGDMSSKGQFE